MFLALQWFAFTYTWTFDCVLTHNIVVETGQLEIYSTGSFFPYWTLQNMNVKLLSLTWKPKPTVIYVEFLNPLYESLSNCINTIKHTKKLNKHFLALLKYISLWENKMPIIVAALNSGRGYYYL